MVWSASDKTLCLWSVSSGIFLGKIGHERDLEESSAGAGTASRDSPVVSRAGSFNDDLARLRINSQRVIPPPPFFTTISLFISITK